MERAMLGRVCTRAPGSADLIMGNIMIARGESKEAKIGKIVKKYYQATLLGWFQPNNS